MSEMSRFSGTRNCKENGFQKRLNIFAEKLCGLYASSALYLMFSNVNF